MCAVIAGLLYYEVLLFWLKGVGAVGVTVRGNQCYRFQVCDYVLPGRHVLT